jgi:hypothetical protein
MNLNEDQLSEIEEMAGLFFSPEDIAVNLELEDEDTELFVAAVASRNTKNYQAGAYLKGWLSAEITLRKAIQQSALNGSSPSQQLMLNYQKESRI